MNIGTAAKIETIALSRNSGTFGDCTILDGGAMRIEVEGRCYIVASSVIGWTVQIGGFTFEDADLWEAARMASMTDASGATRNYRI